MRMMEEARVRELKEFELISMGLEGSKQENNNKKRKAPTMERENGKEEATTAAKIDAATEAFRQREVEVNGKRRKVFELSEAEIARYANSELDRLKKKIEQEKVLSSTFLSIRYMMLIIWYRQKQNPHYRHSGFRQKHRARRTKQR